MESLLRVTIAARPFCPLAVLSSPIFLQTSSPCPTREGLKEQLACRWCGRARYGQRSHPKLPLPLQGSKLQKKETYLLRWQIGDMQSWYQTEISLSEKDQINYRHGWDLSKEWGKTIQRTALKGLWWERIRLPFLNSLCIQAYSENTCTYLCIYQYRSFIRNY